MPTPPWKTVPPPDAVTRLPTTHSGMPVVYITNYETEDVDPDLVVMTDLGAVVMCKCEFGRGKPLIGRQCPCRQREVMINRLCSVCGQPVGDDAEMVFIGATPETAPPPTVAWPYRMWTTVEGPAHHDCAAYSLRTCPHMLNGRPLLVLTRQMTLMPVLAVGADAAGNVRQRLWPAGRRWGRTGALLFYMAVLDPMHSTMTRGRTWLANDAPVPWRGQ